MTTFVIRDDSSPDAMKFIEFARKHPFVEEQNSWQDALDEGAVSVKEFFAEVRRRINEKYDKLDA